jgi:CheY-like chemotaxis protein
MTARTASPKHVLVIDDEPDFAAYMKEILQGLGYRVSVAGNGREALAMAKSCPPDAITLDVQMPEESGLVFYRRLKSDGVLRDIPVIIVSGLPNEEPDWAAFLHVYFDVDRLPHPEAHVDKPVYPDRLQEVLVAIFAQRQPV